MRTHRTVEPEWVSYYYYRWYSLAVYNGKFCKSRTVMHIDFLQFLTTFVNKIQKGTWAELFDNSSAQNGSFRVSTSARNFPSFSHDEMRDNFPPRRKSWCEK